MKRPTSTATAARPAVEPDADPARATAQAQPQVQAQLQAQAPAQASAQASPAPTQARLPAADVPRPRADAVRNRERILTAAREAFVEFGSAAPFDEVARRAGIGNATLYRHFPDRSTLVHHVVLFTMARVTASAEASLAEEPDAFAALCRFTHEAADERIGALCPMLSDGFDGEHPELLAAGTALEAAVVTLLTTGQDAGLVRADIGVGDLMVALSQLSRPLPGTACLDTDRFAHRHLQLFLDGLRAPARSELPGSAATLDDLRQKTM
ncbi:TetR/AcrR family transcriptional regulator [Streptomyces sp. NPDC056491]|uniref:TetR/AcrR family transcriptional regulator n=1 Tax=Streptomyces sp. NPDC056491 TaxID=3345837 RepID=UPI0036A9DBA1